jgi:hypothetical protein
MAFGSQEITQVDYKSLQKVRKLAGTDYKLKGEIAISTINKTENTKQKLIIYYSDEISDTVNIPGLPSHRTFLQGKSYSEMMTDLKLFEQFQTQDHIMAKVNFGANLCSIEGRIYSKEILDE